MKMWWTQKTTRKTKNAGAYALFGGLYSKADVAASRRRVERRRKR